MADFTAAWVFVKTNSAKIQLFLIGVLLFLAGWHVGRLMSPYYSSSEIIFNDRDCTQCSSSGGTSEELSQLREEGIALNTPSPLVAGILSAREGDQFVASVNSDLFHHISCPSAQRIKEENQIWFSSIEEARSAGFQPSSCTEEKLGL